MASWAFDFAEIPLHRRNTNATKEGLGPLHLIGASRCASRGPFYTVVTETTVESLAAWEQYIAEVFSLPEFGEWFARMMPLVESGRREFYHIEE